MLARNETKSITISRSGKVCGVNKTKLKSMMQKHTAEIFEKKVFDHQDNTMADGAPQFP